MLLPAAPKYPDDYAAPRKFVVVVSCIDYRLLDDLVRFLTHENLTNRYYHVAFAGASQLLSDEIAKWPPPACGRPDGRPWRETLSAHLETVITLTGGKLSDVYIVEHRDCGAYEKFLTGSHHSPEDEEGKDDERREHTAFALALRAELEAWFAEYQERAGSEQARPKQPECPKQPLPELPHVHCFLMGLRGEVERLDEPPKRGKKAKQ
jgi:hypothetical protein